MDDSDRPRPLIDNLDSTGSKLKLSEYLHDVLRGMALTISSLLEALGLISEEETQTTSDNICTLTCTYANLQGVVRELVEASDPNGDYFKVMQRWKKLPDYQRREGLISERVMTPEHRNKLLREFDEGVEVLKPFPAFGINLKCLTATVSESNKAYIEQFADVDMDEFGRAIRHAEGAYKTVSELFGISSDWRGRSKNG